MLISVELLIKVPPSYSHTSVNAHRVSLPNSSLLSIPVVALLSHSQAEQTDALATKRYATPEASSSLSLSLMMMPHTQINARARASLHPAVCPPPPSLCSLLWLLSVYVQQSIDGHLHAASSPEQSLSALLSGETHLL